MPQKESEMDSESELDAGTGCRRSGRGRRPTWRFLHSARWTLKENGKDSSLERLQQMLGTSDLMNVSLAVEDTLWYATEQCELNQYHNMRIFQIDAFMEYSNISQNNESVANPLLIMSAPCLMSGAFPYHPSPLHAPAGLVHKLEA